MFPSRVDASFSDRPFVRPTSRKIIDVILGLFCCNFFNSLLNSIFIFEDLGFFHLILIAYDVIYLMVERDRVEK